MGRGVKQPHGKGERRKAKNERKTVQLSKSTRTDSDRRCAGPNVERRTLNFERELRPPAARSDPVHSPLTHSSAFDVRRSAAAGASHLASAAPHPSPRAPFPAVRVRLSPFAFLFRSSLPPVDVPRSSYRSCADPHSRLVEEIALLAKREMPSEHSFPSYGRVTKACDARAARLLVGQRNAEGNSEYQLAAAVEFDSSLFKR